MQLYVLSALAWLQHPASRVRPMPPLHFLALPTTEPNTQHATVHMRICMGTQTMMRLAVHIHAELREEPAGRG